ncbi:MAG: hypothetical protein ACRD3Q_14310 [Terriglobales bacterium]
MGKLYGRQPWIGNIGELIDQLHDVGESEFQCAVGYRARADGYGPGRDILCRTHGGMGIATVRGCHMRRRELVAQRFDVSAAEPPQ